MQLTAVGAQPWLFPYGTGWPQGYWGAPGPTEPSPIKAFDGSPEKLVFFLNSPGLTWIDMGQLTSTMWLV